MSDKALSSLTQGIGDAGDFLYGVVGGNSRKIQIDTLPFVLLTDDQLFERIGIGGAVPDDTNRLSVNSPAVLFNREVDDVQVKLNKETAGDTASFLFQTGFSGRAEIGLVGSDDFVFKVSPDGNSFVTGISIDKDSGQVTFPLLFSPNGGISASQTGPTTGDQGVTFELNSISATDASAVSDTASAFKVGYGVGDAGGHMTGQHVAITGQTVLLHASAPDLPLLKVYTGLSGISQADVADGGISTDGGSESLGYILGINAVSLLNDGAVNFLHVSPLECLTSMRTGSSSRYHIGAKVVQFFDHAVSGAALDAAFQFLNQSGAIGWKDYGIIFDADSDGSGTLFLGTATIIGTKGSMSVTNGIDLSSATISGNAFASNGFSVNGVGDIANGSPGFVRGRHFFAGPTSGQTTLQASDVAGGTLSLPNATGVVDYHVEGSLADDTATSVTPPRTTGLVELSVQGNVGGTFLYATSTPNMTAIAGPGSSGAAATGVLAGTTGADTKFTISAHTDGKIYFENRLGFTQTFRYRFL